MDSRILNVSFSAKRPDVPGEEFYQPQYLRERVYLHRADLVKLATVEVGFVLLLEVPFHVYFVFCGFNLNLEPRLWSSFYYWI